AGFAVPGAMARQRHDMGDFLIGIQQEALASHGVVNHNEGVWLVDSELAHRGHAAFLAEAALAIAIQGYLMSVRNFVAVGQTVAERGYRNGAERRTGDYFSAVESADAKQ